jgi:hypothetical protein
VTEFLYCWTAGSIIIPLDCPTIHSIIMVTVSTAVRTMNHGVRWWYCCVVILLPLISVQSFHTSIRSNSLSNNRDSHDTCWADKWTIVVSTTPLSHRVPFRSNNHGDVGSSVVLFMGKSRKAQNTKKVERSRPQNFFDAIADARDEQPVSSTVLTTPVPNSNNNPDDDSDTNNQAVMSSELQQQQKEREARAVQARQRMDQRPEVSTMIVDEETGMEIVAQGKAVMDVVTRKAVQLSPGGARVRLAQMFPGVPQDIRDQYRYDWKQVTVPEMIQGLKMAASVKLEDGNHGIPPHPSVANSALDFVIANRDYLGARMKRTLGRVTMRSMSLGNLEEGKELQQLWKNFLTLENHISAPFRQMMLDAEGRVGPNFGNLDIATYCKGDLYERCANYLVLKGMVAHWEKKLVDADYTERTIQTKDNYVSVMARGDPRRFLPDPPILFTLKECTQVCAMAQQMTKAFVETPSLFDDLPPEVRFVEAALAIQGGTALRQFVVDDFCPKENVTPQGLREGLRRLICQLENMQVDPYADLTNILERLSKAMSVGTDDERNPYEIYLANKDPNGPGKFQTYTFNHEKLSLVRFLDSQYESAGDASSTSAPNPESSLGGFENLFGGFMSSSTPSNPPVDRRGTSSNDEVGDFYTVPKERAAGRPHNLGWLDLLNDNEGDGVDLRLGKVPPGRIIVE